MRITLVNLGYPEAAVNRFFAPLLEHNVDVVDKREEARGFYAYINPNGNLVNEGIVATGPFIARLERARAASSPRARRRRPALLRRGGARGPGADDPCRAAQARHRAPQGPGPAGGLRGRGRRGARSGGRARRAPARTSSMAAIEREFAASMAGRAAEAEGTLGMTRGGPPPSSGRAGCRAWPPPRRGKVRDVYDLGDAMLIVASDRLSAYDHVLRPGIPGKGKVLTQLSTFWFDRLADVVPHHLLATDPRRLSATGSPSTPSCCAAGRSWRARRGWCPSSAWPAATSRAAPSRSTAAAAPPAASPLPAGLERASRLPRADLHPRHQGRERARREHRLRRPGARRRRRSWRRACAT